MERNDKREKRKSLIWKIVGFIVILAISIATSSMNLAQVGKEFLLSFVEFGWIASDKSSNEGSSVYVKGNHVKITNDDILRVRELCEIMETDDSEESAVATLKEIKTLNYYGEQAGYIVAKSEIQEYIDDLTVQLKKSSKFKYNTLIESWGSEKEYWNMMRGSVQEKLMADLVLEEQEKIILERNENADVDAELGKYVEKLLQNEEFNR